MPENVKLILLMLDKLALLLKYLKSNNFSMKNSFSGFPKCNKPVPIFLNMSLAIKTPFTLAQIPMDPYHNEH